MTYKKAKTFRKRKIGTPRQVGKSFPVFATANPLYGKAKITIAKARRVKVKPTLEKEDWRGPFRVGMPLSKPAKPIPAEKEGWRGPFRVRSPFAEPAKPIEAYKVAAAIKREKAKTKWLEFEEWVKGLPEEAKLQVKSYLARKKEAVKERFAEAALSAKERAKQKIREEYERQRQSRIMAYWRKYPELTKEQAEKEALAVIPKRDIKGIYRKARRGLGEVAAVIRRKKRPSVKEAETKEPEAKEITVEVS